MVLKYKNKKTGQISSKPSPEGTAKSVALQPVKVNIGSAVPQNIKTKEDRDKREAEIRAIEPQLAAKKTELIKSGNLAPGQTLTPQDLEADKQKQEQTAQNVQANLQSLQGLTNEQQNKDILKTNEAQQNNITGALLAAGATGGIVKGATGSLGATAGGLGGGLIGGIAGLGLAFAFKTRAERSDIKVANEVRKNSMQGLNRLLGSVNDPMRSGMTKQEAIVAYKNYKANLYAAERVIKERNDNEIEKALVGGNDDLIEIQDAIAQLPQIERELAIAFESPDLAKAQMYFMASTTPEVNQ